MYIYKKVLFFFDVFQRDCFWESKEHGNATIPQNSRVAIERTMFV